MYAEEGFLDFVKNELHAGSTSLHYSYLLYGRYCIKYNFCMGVSVYVCICVCVYKWEEVKFNDWHLHFGLLPRM